MRSASIIPLLFVVGAMHAAAVGADESGKSARIERIDRVVQEYKSKSSIPGIALVLHVSKPHEEPLTITRCYGSSNLEKRVPVTSATLFPLASLTKLFTAAGIIALEKDHKLRLDDAVTKWLPDAPKSWSDVTIRHLLSHTSGLPPETSNGKSWSGSLERLAMQSRVAPGTESKYNNVAYVLLGRIIERASGASLEKFFADRIFTPRDMKSTLIPSSINPPGLAMGYTIQNAKASPHRNFQDWKSMGGSGGVVSNATDLASWSPHLTELPSEVWQECKLASGKPIPYTCGGWEITYTDNQKCFQKQGNMTGYTCSATYIPASHTTLVILTNAGNRDLKTLSQKILRLVRN